MVKCPHSPTFKFDSHTIVFTVLTIQFSSNCQMDIANQPMLKCLTKACWKEKPDRKLYHVTVPLLQTSLVQVVAYAFSWFTKFHGFMIPTGTTKIGIQQIKLSIHTIREILQNFIYCILHSYKFVNCIFLSFHHCYTLYCTQY